MQVPEPHPGSTTVTLTDNESVQTQQPGGRNRWPVIAAAAAVVAIVVGGLLIVIRDDDQTGEIPADQPATAAPKAAPVEFTACIGPGPSVMPGPEEIVTATLPDGDTTLTQRRGGYTWQSTVSDVSDPRLDGTWCNSIDFDEYTLAEGVNRPSFHAVRHHVRERRRCLARLAAGDGLPGRRQRPESDRADRGGRLRGAHRGCDHRLRRAALSKHPGLHHRRRRSGAPRAPHRPIAGVASPADRRTARHS